MPFRHKAFSISSAFILGAACTGIAQAGSSLLFPYITTADGAYTFVTIFNNPFPVKGLAETPEVTKSNFTIGYVTTATDTSLGEPCVGLVFNADFVSSGGLLQWEVGNRFDLPADFGDQGRLDYNVNNIAANRHGHMVIRYDNSATTEQIYGEALVVDSTNGTALSYAAIQMPSSSGNFSSKAGSEFVSGWYPRPLSGTSWYVLPVGTIDTMLHLNNVNTTVEVSTNSQNPGAFERNGQYHAGGGKIRVPTCAGIYGIDDLIPDYRFSMGGWFSLKTQTIDDKGKENAQPALVWKIQESRAFGFPVTTMHPVTIIQ